jgi:hypothetical protein
VGVDNVYLGFLYARANGERRAQIPVPTHRQGLGLESSDLRPLKKR